jgi:excisionase family DNA binding protein
VKAEKSPNSVGAKGAFRSPIMHRDNPPVVSALPVNVPVVLTVEQLAHAFCVSPATVRRLHAKGRLPVQPLRLGRRLLFPMAAVQSFLSEKHPTQN